MRTRQNRFASVLRLRKLAPDYPPAVQKESAGVGWSIWPLGVHPIDGAGMVLAKGPCVKGQSGTDIEGISAGLCLAAVSPKETRYVDEGVTLKRIHHAARLQGNGMTLSGIVTSRR